MDPKTPCLLIDSRSAFAQPDGGFAHVLALQLARDGVPVTLMLVANGVLGARRGARGRSFDELVAAGVRVLADDFSLRERGLDGAQLASGVASSALDVVVDSLVDGWHVIWH